MREYYTSVSMRIIATPKMRASIGISPVFRYKEQMMKMPYPNFIQVIRMAYDDEAS